MFALLRDRPAAESEFRAALAIQQKLIADYPVVPDYRNDLARTTDYLDNLASDRGERTAAKEEERSALAVREKLADDFPAKPEYGIAVAKSYFERAHSYWNSRDPAAALPWYGKTIDRLTPIVTTDPRQAATRKQYLDYAHFGRARALTALHRYGDALPDWDAALTLNDGAGRMGLRVSRADCLARIGRAADAYREASEVAADPHADRGTLYSCAAVLSLASAISDNRDADAHAAEAVKVLRRSIANGEGDLPRLLSHLLTNPDLAPLRKRADYAALLWDITDMPVQG
jgi:tetratricopeptide (TPR) repeat protein